MSDAPSKESLERAWKLANHLGLYHWSKWNVEQLALKFDAIRRERDEAAEKAKGQLDIIQRECEGEDEAFLANDYGGTGWEREAPVTTVREIRQAAEKLAEATQAAWDALDDYYDVDEPKPGHRKEYPFNGAGEVLRKLREALAAWRERVSPERCS